MKSFNHSQEYHKNRVLSDAMHNMSLLEIVSFMVFTSMIAAVVFISIWSSALLIIGKTQGGGPLGMIANIISEILTNFYPKTN